MSKKPVKKFMFEINGEKIGYTNLKKLIDTELEKQGVMLSDDINYYFNLNELIVYAVVNGTTTYKVSLCK